MACSTPWPRRGGSTCPRRWTRLQCLLPTGPRRRRAKHPAPTMTYDGFWHRTVSGTSSWRCRPGRACKRPYGLTDAADERHCDATLMVAAPKGRTAEPTYGRGTGMMSGAITRIALPGSVGGGVLRLVLPVVSGSGTVIGWAFGAPMVTGLAIRENSLKAFRQDWSGSSKTSRRRFYRRGPICGRGCTGSSRATWPKSNSQSGRGTTSCAIQASLACVRTRIRVTSSWADRRWNLPVWAGALEHQYPEKAT
jgi:hypothetical protein